jgi:cytochrome c553
MRSRGLESVVAGVWLAWAWTSPAQAATAQVLVHQGNGHGAPPCQSCHGADGEGLAAGGFPRLAALDAGYLRRQLDDYAQGTRTHAVMQPIAKALSADERNAVSQYYARLPTPEKTATAQPADGAAGDTGALLATRGRWSARVPACEQCHGPGGIGVGANFPPLAGQPAAYLAAQLKAWQQGTRRNDPLQLMQHLSRALSASDIAAVAQWFAAQPLPAGSNSK